MVLKPLGSFGDLSVEEGEFDAQCKVIELLFLGVFRRNRIIGKLPEIYKYQIFVCKDQKYFNPETFKTKSDTGLRLRLKSSAPPPSVKIPDLRCFIPTRNTSLEEVRRSQNGRDTLLSQAARQRIYP